jgi:hypothetical protein
MQDGNIIQRGESKLMCKNWDLGVMRRRYRAEEIQEIFAKSASSLRCVAAHLLIVGRLCGS